MLADATPSAGAASGDGRARAEVLRIAGARAGGCREARRLTGGERGDRLRCPTSRARLEAMWAMPILLQRLHTMSVCLSLRQRRMAWAWHELRALTYAYKLIIKLIQQCTQL